MPRNRPGENANNNEKKTQPHKMLRVFDETELSVNDTMVQRKQHTLSSSSSTSVVPITGTICCNWSPHTHTHHVIPINQFLCISHLDRIICRRFDRSSTKPVHSNNLSMNKSSRPRHTDESSLYLSRMHTSGCKWRVQKSTSDQGSRIHCSK